MRKYIRIGLSLVSMLTVIAAMTICGFAEETPERDVCFSVEEQTLNKNYNEETGAYDYVYTKVETTKDYTIDELLEMKKTSPAYRYSNYNSWCSPATGEDFEVKEYVRIDDILEDAGVTVEPGDLIEFSDGGYTKRLTYDQYAVTRYRYPNLKEVQEGAPVTEAARAGKTQVPMVIEVEYLGVTDGERTYTLYVGQQEPNEQNNPLFVKNMFLGGHIRIIHNGMDYGECVADEKGNVIRNWGRIPEWVYTLNAEDKDGNVNVTLGEEIKLRYAGEKTIVRSLYAQNSTSNLRRQYLAYLESKGQSPITSFEDGTTTKDKKIYYEEAYGTAENCATPTKASGIYNYSSFLEASFLYRTILPTELGPYTVKTICWSFGHTSSQLQTFNCFVNGVKLTPSAGEDTKTYVKFISRTAVANDETVALGVDKVVLGKGKSTRLDAEAYFDKAFAEAEDITWESSNSNIATVADGEISAVDYGTAIITASAGGYEASVEVIVPEFRIIAKTGTYDTITDGSGNRIIAVSVREDDFENEGRCLLSVGTAHDIDSKTLAAIQSETVWNAAGGTTYASFNTTNHYVTGKKAGGSITVSATVLGETISTSISIVDFTMPFGLNKETLALETGDTDTLSTVGFTRTDYADIIWVSSDSTVVSVDANGKITALKPGKAEIIAKSFDLVWSDPSCIVTVTPAAVQNFGITEASGNTRTLKWTKQAGVDGYTIYNVKTGEAVEEIEGNVNTCSLKEKYGELAIKAYYIDENSEKVYSKDYSASIFAKPVMGTLTATDITTSAVKLGWKKVGGVSGYEVVNVTTGKKYTVSADATSKIITGLTAGKVYKFKVRAYYTVGENKCYGDYSSIKYVPIKPAAVKLTKLTTGSRYIKATWGKKTCTRYQLQYSTGKTFKASQTKTVTVTASTVSKKITGLKKGKTYYVRVRAYTSYGTAASYGAWSNVKSVKCK